MKMSMIRVSLQKGISDDALTFSLHWNSCEIQMEKIDECKKEEKLNRIKWISENITYLLIWSLISRCKLCAFYFSLYQTNKSFIDLEGWNLNSFELMAVVMCTFWSCAFLHGCTSNITIPSDKCASCRVILDANTWSWDGEYLQPSGIF